MTAHSATSSPASNPTSSRVLTSAATPQPATPRVPFSTSRGPLARLTRWYCRHSYGEDLDPASVMLHNRRVLLTTLATETGVARWSALDPTLKALAALGTAAQVGCAWCLDFGYWTFRNQDVDPAKLRAVPRWHDDEVAAMYTTLERLVLEYAEAMTTTPVAVSDHLVAKLREHLTDAAVVELTATIAVENHRSRTNAAMGLHSQGFAERCEIPPAGARPRPA